MEKQGFQLGLADGAYGAGDVEPLTVFSVHEMRGPELPNWQAEYLLAGLEAQIEWRGEIVLYVTLSPRYVGGTVVRMVQKGGLVAVGRVRPGFDPVVWTTLDPAGVDYWGVGTLKLLEA